MAEGCRGPRDPVWGWCPARHGCPAPHRWALFPHQQSSTLRWDRDILACLCCHQVMTTMDKFEASTGIGGSAGSTFTGELPPKVHIFNYPINFTLSIWCKILQENTEFPKRFIFTVLWFPSSSVQQKLATDHAAYCNFRFNPILLWIINH